MRRAAWLLFYSLLFYLCLGSNAQSADKVRAWTKTDGSTMRAQFIREVDGDVTFLKDGKLHTMPLDQLSEADRQLVRDVESGKIAVEEPRLHEPIAPIATPAPPASVPALSGEPKVPSLTKKKTAIVERVWTFAEANQTTAKFVRLHQQNVVLLRGARTVMIPYESLSKADQDYVRELLTARGEEALLPPPTAVSEEPSGVNSAAPDQPAVAAQPAPPENDDPGPAAVGGNSAFFDELKNRQQERRDEQAAYIAGAGQDSVDLMHGAPPSYVADTAGPAAGDRPRGEVDPLMARDVRGAIVIVGVTVGLIGSVGVIVFIAISIAAATKGSKRRYSA